MKLAKQLYVKIEAPENDEPYFVAATDPADLVEVGDKIKVGIYQLMGHAEVAGTTTIKRRKP